MSKNIHCLPKLPAHDSFSYESVCLQVSASHTTVLVLLSWATSQAMEMSNVVFTVPALCCAVQSAELLAADTHLSTMFLP